MRIRTENICKRSGNLYSLQPAHESLASEVSLNWYVVQSKPREEERAFHFLSQKNLQSYLPRMEIVTTRGSRNITKRKPLFPGYLFCRFDPQESLGYVRWTKGVAKLLPESVNPIPIKENIITAICELEHEDGIIRKQPLEKNQAIRIARGPMKDVMGIFDQWTSDSGRVRVLLSFVNYQASVELHHSFVERVI